MKKRIRTEEEQAFVEGIELAIDYGLGDELSKEDWERANDLRKNTLPRSVFNCTINGTVKPVNTEKTKEKIFNILTDYTEKNGIMASRVILEKYAEELAKNGCIVPDLKEGD